MRPLNLIPPEERRGDSAPLRAGALSYIVVGVLAAALLAVVTLVLTSNDINDSKSQLASLQVREAAAEQASQSLAPYDNFATLATSRNATVLSLARSRFDWERVLQELALVIPSDVTLQSINATATAGGGGADATVSGPSLQIDGCADGQEGTARLLAALRDIDGVTRVGMQSSALADGASGPSAGAPTTGCAASGAATFQITVAFDAVPAAATAPADASGVPATTTTTPPATETTATNTTSTPDGGIAQTQSEQQDAANSAADQTGKAHNAASTVGVAK
jgi:Tfp pilus assembly protein PilN